MEPLDPTRDASLPPAGSGAPATEPAAAQVHVHVRRNVPAVIILIYIVGFFALTSSLLFVCVLALAVSKAPMPQLGPKKTFVERTLANANHGPDKILVLNIDGMMTNVPEKRLLSETLGMVDRFDKMLSQSEKDPNIKAVLIRVNTPGGSITTADMMHVRLMDYRKKTKRKIVTLMDDVAASGGYYVAAACDRIVAHPTTLTGSIGVIMPLISFKGALDKLGVKPQPIKSRPLKDLGAFYREMTESERQVLQGIVDELYLRFVSVVQDGADRRGVRRLTRKKILALSDGRVFTGEQASENGLVDEIGYFRDAVAATLKIAGLKKARVVQYRPRSKGLIELLQSQAATPQSRDITLRIEGLGLPSSSTPMYLWCPGAPVLLSSGPRP